MKKLAGSDKDIDWYLNQMSSHVREIRELVKAGVKPYRGQETCIDHARVEAYDLIVLTAEAFKMPDILNTIPPEIIERFNRKKGIKYS